MPERKRRRLRYLGPSSIRERLLYVGLGISWIGAGVLFWLIDHELMWIIGWALIGIGWIGKGLLPIRPTDFGAHGDDSAGASASTR